jgi:hypothetical protein
MSREHEAEIWAEENDRDDMKPIEAPHRYRDSLYGDGNNDPRH